MSDENFVSTYTTGIIKESKKALREQRDARLTKSLRVNLARRKLQMRARNDRNLINEPEAAND
jgi:hypothetical protein